MPSMTNYQIGDLLLVDFPFTTHDVPISAWQQAGLLAPSTVRLHKLATIAKSRVHRLVSADRQTVGAVLRQIAAAW